MKYNPSRPASALGRIVGYNSDSGMLYKTQMGTSQFKYKTNVFPTAINYSSYTNKMNTMETIKEMNADGDVDFYEGKMETLKVQPEQQPEPFTLKASKTQDTF